MLDKSELIGYLQRWVERLSSVEHRVTRVHLDRAAIAGFFHSHAVSLDVSTDGQLTSRVAGSDGSYARGSTCQAAGRTSLATVETVETVATVVCCIQPSSRVLEAFALDWSAKLGLSRGRRLANHQTSRLASARLLLRAAAEQLTLLHNQVHRPISDPPTTLLRDTSSCCNR